MNIETVQIKHHELGVIKIRKSIPKDIEETIGDITFDGLRNPIIYHADIEKLKDNCFSFVNFRVIIPETVNVGWMNNSKGNKNFITVIKNISAGDAFIAYPSSILTVIYTTNKHKI
tara:strand:- start:1655 stop:2002 length:348 start_codon:yes stop_codon:yes gene_type:complete